MDDRLQLNEVLTEMPSSVETILFRMQSEANRRLWLAHTYDVRYGFLEPFSMCPRLRMSVMYNGVAMACELYVSYLMDPTKHQSIMDSFNDMLDRLISLGDSVSSDGQDADTGLASFIAGILGLEGPSGESEGEGTEPDEDEER